MKVIPESVKTFFSFLLIASIIVFGFILKSTTKETLLVDGGQVSLMFQNGTTSVATVAHTEKSRSVGLSQTEMLPERRAMLFVFDIPDRHGFWMKDMLYPIDILWLSEDLKILHIVEYADPSSYPTIFTPAQKAMYVIEVPAGFVDREDLQIGQSVHIR